MFLFITYWFFSEIRWFSHLLGSIIYAFKCFSLPVSSVFPLCFYILLFVLVSVFNSFLKILVILDWMPIYRSETIKHQWSSKYGALRPPGIYWTNYFSMDNHQMPISLDSFPWTSLCQEDFHNLLLVLVSTARAVWDVLRPGLWRHSHRMVSCLSSLVSVNFTGF